MQLRLSSIKIPLLLCTLLWGVLSPAQNSEDRWSANVERQLELVSSRLRSAGLSKTKTWIDAMPTGNQQYIDFSLTAHNTYHFIGVCDQDCQDLDLYLRDGDGNLIDSDTSPDDTPIVTVTPKYDGNFRLYVKMVRCVTSPCRWAVGSYQ